MKYIVTDEQYGALSNHIQSLIDMSLNSIREESEEWGLGEMDEIEEIRSISAMIIERISSYNGINVHVIVFSNSERDDFNNTRAEIQYRLEEWIPSLKIFISGVIQ